MPGKKITEKNYTITLIFTVDIMAFDQPPAAQGRIVQPAADLETL